MMYTMSLRFEADIYCLLHTWYNSIKSEIEDLDNSGFVCSVADYLLIFLSKGTGYLPAKQILFMRRKETP